MSPIRRAEGEEKEKLVKELTTEIVPYYFNIYNDKAKSGYIVNGKLSWADIYLICFIDQMEALVGAGVLDKFPNLKALQARHQGMDRKKSLSTKTTSPSNIDLRRPGSKSCWKPKYKGSLLKISNKPKMLTAGLRSKLD